MARFVLNQTLVTREPRIVVDAGLRPGLHRFRLVVSDDAGNASRPDELVVQVSALTPVGGFVPVRRAVAAAPAATPAAAPAATPAAAPAATPAAAPVAARAASLAPSPPSPPPKPFRSRPR
jgi:hypothetical protein